MDRDTWHLLTIFLVVFVLVLTDYPGRKSGSSAKEIKLVQPKIVVSHRLAQQGLAEKIFNRDF